MKKLFLLLLLVIILFPIILFLYGRRSTLDSSEYLKLRTFDLPSFQNRKLAQTDTLTIVTYNIGYLSGMTNNLPLDREETLFKNNLHKTIALFSEVEPDIIGFQEIDMGAERSYNYNQVDSLAIALGFPNVYQSVNWDKNYVPFPYWPPSKQFGRMVSGQAVFSKFPILDHESIILEKPINASFLYNNFYLDRIVQITQQKIGKDTVCVMNLHLEAFDKETRVAQAKLVKELFEKYAKDQPVLLIGDFNSKPEYVDEDDGINEIMTAQDIASAIDHAQYLNDSTASYTFSSGKPYQMIDYILYNQQFIKPVSAEVLSEAGEISDHLPLMMKFVIAH